MDIDALREEIKKAYAYVKERGGVIAPGSFGTDRKMLEVVPGFCYCPIAALELLRQQRRRDFAFDYSPFIEGFDSKLNDEQAQSRARCYTNDARRQLFLLGHEFRAQYVKKAA